MKCFMTGCEVMQKLKTVPYEEWFEIFVALNNRDIETEDIHISKGIMDYIESSCEYIPELKMIFVEKNIEFIKETNLFFEKYLLENGYDCQNQSKKGNGKFNKIFSALKRGFLPCKNRTTVNDKKKEG